MVRISHETLSLSAAAVISFNYSCFAANVLLARARPKAMENWRCTEQGGQEELRPKVLNCSGHPASQGRDRVVWKEVAGDPRCHASGHRLSITTSTQQKMATTATLTTRPKWSKYPSRKLRISGVKVAVGARCLHNSECGYLLSVTAQHPQVCFSVVCWTTNRYHYIPALFL